MNFLKKIFGSKDNTESETKNGDGLEPYKKTPWMTDLRLKNMSVCLNSGFKPANSLPTKFKRKLRPSIEIANRLHAIKALVLWLMIPQENLQNKEIINFIEEVTGKSVSEYRKFWRRKLFSGQGVPPKRILSENEMKLFIQKYKGAIGILKSGSIIKNLKVLKIK